MALMPRPFAVADAHPSTADGPSLRRCTFRRVTTVGKRRGLPVHEFACTFPDRSKSVGLGDLEAARPICEACTYQGIFRPDSD
jgi:hypothetical protein